MFDFSDEVRAHSGQRPEIATRGGQEKRDEVDTRIGPGEVQRGPGDGSAKTEGVWSQDQAEIPLIAFLLEPAPSDITAIGEDRPVTQPVALPGGFFFRHEALGNSGT